MGKKTSSFWYLLWNRPFFIRLRSWEYWPMHVIYSPIYLYWLFLSLRARAFVFFSAANPGIEFSGFIGDSKMEILDKIPARWIPKTLYVSKNTPIKDVLAGMKAKEIDFPLIAKPDIGERGFLVEKVDNLSDLKLYLEKFEIDVLVQEFIDLPEEISVLYYRYPDDKQGHITSVTLKKFLTITGDGVSTVEELVKQYPRAKLQLAVLSEKFPERMKQVLPAGEAMELVPIGNHSRGTTFLNGNHLIDERLHATFDQISHSLEGIYFGRFDMKCESMEALKAGRNFKILEINGVKAEPTHIYEPGFSIWKAYQVLFNQWNIIYKISMANHAKGISFMSLKEAIHRVAVITKYKRMAYK